MTDRVFAIAGDWALASDGVQWILMKHFNRKSGKCWDPVSFVRSTRDILARCMTEKGVPPGTAVQLLAGLPDTFDQWLTNPPVPAEAAAALQNAEDPPHG